MLKQTINYINFDGEPATTTAYFNLQPREIRDLNIPEMVRQAEKVNEEFQKLINDPNQDQNSMDFKQTTNELVGQFLDVIEGIIDVSYGVRLDDNRFRKSPELLQEFKETAAFSDFLVSFANEPDVAKRFFDGLLPKGVAASDSSLPAQVSQHRAPQDHLPSARENFAKAQQERQNETEEQMRARIRAEILAETQRGE